MEAEIRAALHQIESEMNVRVLYACESGSRAWGFDSIDSDYDARFIYIHPTDWYLTIESKRDVIERMLPGDLDCSGWDLRKALGLLRKSNPPLFEWLRSPIVYLQDDAFISAFRTLAEETYSPTRCFYHYRGMAEGNVRNYFQTDLVPLKKYLYVLRPLLACRWIERGLGPVPMEFDHLVETLVDDEALLNEIADLLRAKRSGNEMGKGPKLPQIQRFVDEEFVRLKNLRMPASPLPAAEPLDEFFRACLRGIGNLPA